MSFKKKTILQKDIRLATARIIAGLLAERGLTQSEASKRLGKTRSWMNLLLNGHYNVKMQDLFDICMAFGAKPSEIVDRIERWKA
jgi:transcriptional regulator with XRE-family HTH domain